MKLYCGKNLNGIWKASLNEAKVDKFSDLFESDVDVIHNNKVYMIQIYHGYDYNYGSETNSIFDVTTYVRQLFHSVMSAKKCDVWEEKERLAKENPEEYHVTPFSIASDDFGEPFICGDCFSGKFNMKIIGVRVI